jgi:hypothetical protein
MTAVVLATGGVGAAADTPMTWDQAAAQVKFPVYQPMKTLGLKPSSLAVSPCTAPPLPRSLVTAAYGNAKSRKGPSFGLIEAYPGACGNDGEAKSVRTVRVNGVRSSLLVNCVTLKCDVTIDDLYKNGFQLYVREPGAKRTRIELFGRHISLANVLKIARSLTKVTPGT